MSSLSSLQINKPIEGFGRTPLMFACYKGADRRIIDILIDAGSQIEEKDRWGFTALHWAVLRKHLQTVELLLSRGSNINEKTNRGYTPLHLAANSSPEWTDGVKAIMNRSAVEVNPRNEDGRTPLHLACWRGHLHTVDLLLGHNGIDANVVDNDGDTPLHEAVRMCRLQAVELLLSRGCNVNEKTKRGYTPLHLAANSSPEWTDGVKSIMNQSAVEVILEMTMVEHRCTGPVHGDTCTLSTFCWVTMASMPMLWTTMETHHCMWQFGRETMNWCLSAEP
ncbi:serine/threonine-protein phosphatase 6 regulatory ankyrin repeat subunit A-like, partial [Octopus sinensis]|uniref:Serine/threonine-protein phosphatase 6 regulatory ankyrin repeat subunit A-like n=1 Tax=Octopus sinensis TaxID=2607531 RepID=A0A7E6EI02_9MOLL